MDAAPQAFPPTESHPMTQPIELRPRRLVAHSADVQGVTAQAVSFLQQQEAVTGKRTERDLAGAGERVSPVAGEQELVFKDILDGEVAGLAGQRDQHGVQLSVFQADKYRCRLLLSQVNG